MPALVGYLDRGRFGGLVVAAATIGPLFLTFTLTRWSGAPLLEGGMKKSRPGYAAYKARTSAFFPLRRRNPPASRRGVNPRRPT